MNVQKEIKFLKYKKYKYIFKQESALKFKGPNFCANNFD